MNLESIEIKVVPLKDRVPGNHPNLTDVSLRHVGWLRSGQFPQYPSGTRHGEPLRVHLCSAPGCHRLTTAERCERHRPGIGEDTGGTAAPVAYPPRGADFLWGFPNWGPHLVPRTEPEG
jgi:hypothetical protein